MLRTIPIGSAGMFSSAVLSTLVVLVGFALLVATGLLRAFSRTVDVAAVTMAANDRQTAATRTQVQATRSYIDAAVTTAM